MIPSSGGGTSLYNGEWRMRQNAALAHLGGTAILLAVTGWSGAATAQVNCETITSRAGPDRLLYQPQPYRPPKL